MTIETCANGFLKVKDGAQTFYVQGMQAHCARLRHTADDSRPSCTCPDGFSHPFWCAHKHFANEFVTKFGDGIQGLLWDGTRHGGAKV